MWNEGRNFSETDDYPEASVKKDANNKGKLLDRSSLPKVGSCVCLGDSPGCTRLHSISLMQQRVRQLISHTCALPQPSVSVAENLQRGQIGPHPARSLPVWRLSLLCGFSRGSIHFCGGFASVMYANLEFASSTDNLSLVTCGGSLDKADLSYTSLSSTLFFPE